MTFFPPLTKNKKILLVKLSENDIDNKSLWGIAWMSFFWSFASVMIFSLLPTFFTDILGASKKTLGFMEGMAVFLSFIAKVFAGILSDVFKARRPMIMIGTALTVIVKIGFALSTSALHVIWARSLDRLIKGWRSAPTDALIADLSTKEKIGSAYGVRQSLYVLGGFTGGIAASLLMTFYHNNYYLVFWAALIPALLALFVLIFFIKESKTIKIKQNTWSLKDIKKLPLPFWIILIVTFFLMLARFSPSFLNLRARECHVALSLIPLLVALYEIAQAVVAWPFGKLADTYDRKKLLLLGIPVLTFTNFILIFMNNALGVVFGMIFAGIHLGMTQGLLSTLIAESSLPHMRGTAFALYYSTIGVAVLIGNVFAGSFSDYWGSSVGAFAGGAFWTSLSFLILLISRKILLKKKTA